jgi:hypothetical protein
MLYLDSLHSEIIDFDFKSKISYCFVLVYPYFISFRRTKFIISIHSLKKIYNYRRLLIDQFN